MARFLTTYVIGVLSGIAFMMLLGDENTDDRDQEAISSENIRAQSPSSAEADQRSEPDGSGNAFGSDEDSSFGVSPATLSGDIERLQSSVEIESIQDQAESVDAQSARGEVINQQSGDAGDDAATETDSDSSRDTSQRAELPVTHDPLVSNTPIEDDFDDFQAEERDGAWAETAERLIYTHVVSHPAGQEIGILVSVCRQSQCWLVGTAYGANGRQNWTTVRDDFRQQPWFGNYFAGITGESSALGPDGHRFVTVFLRAGYSPEPVFAE